MRRKIKKDIVNIIGTMLKAHEHAEILLINKRITEARELLSQCQDCALYIGENIEKSEGMGTKVVSYLELYCEQLYEMSQCLNKNEIINLKNKLDSSLYNVEFDIKEKIITDTLKIVFMPYKASMWDCMESIWEAAEKDDNCETYVVPIPYYERNTEGTIEREVYEGNLFPDYIPIVFYKDFALEKENPDIVYIHNPYDNGNYVTCVNPEFYSSNLKRNTDCLIYIPYFLLGNGPLPESHRNLPAYLHVDKIVVQDEEKGESLLDYVPKEKIVVLGSPKVDHLLKLKKERQTILETVISQEWRKKIKGKKVILFNISITGILKNSDCAMDKIKYVLSIFSNRNDVVLWWRPHPLMEATLKSMRPKLYTEYMNIKKDFIYRNKDIFDETGDAGIAAVIADAYLGENTSSLVHYFGVLGKPIMYIDWKVINDNNKSRDFYYLKSFFQEDESLYFTPINKGLEYDLYELNWKKGELNKKMRLPGIPGNIEIRYSAIKKIRDKIILIPCNTEDIYIYINEKKQAIKIVLSKYRGNTDLFNEAVEYQGKLFLIPTCYPAIVSIDLDSFEVKEYCECISSFLMEDDREWMFTYGYCKKEQYLYLASLNDNRILLFNMDDGSYTIKRIGNYSMGFGDMVYDGESFWLAAVRNNCIIRWNEESENTSEYEYPVEDEESKNTAWSLILSIDNEIMVCYGFSMNIVFIDKNTGKCRQHKGINRALTELKRNAVSNKEFFSRVQFLDEKNIIIINWKNSSVNIWNFHTQQWKHIPCRLPEEEMLHMEKKQVENSWISKQTPYNLSEHTVSISQYVDYIVQNKGDVFKQSYECYLCDKYDSTIGLKIHEYFKK